MMKELEHSEAWEQGLLLGDEWANCLTHGAGLLLSVVGLILLIQTPLQENNSWRLLIFAVYGMSLVFLYAASTCYHALKKPKIKKILRKVDHCAIYLLIAGSYTPFSLMVLGDVLGWTLFIVVWCLAFFGIFYKIFFFHHSKVFSTVLYLFMGWLVVLVAEPLIERFHIHGLGWLVGGGLFYSMGVIFFIFDKRKFYHAIWHLFVLGGSLCHYLAIFFYL